MRVGNRMSPLDHWLIQTCTFTTQQADLVLCTFVTRTARGRSNGVGANHLCRHGTYAHRGVDAFDLHGAENDSVTTCIVTLHQR